MASTRAKSSPAENADGIDRLSFVVPPAMRLRLVELAKKNERTVAGEIRTALTAHLKRHAA